MRLNDIACKNIKGNAYKYLMYYLSNTLAVTVFFIFANFIFNPEVADAKYLGSPGMLTSRGLILCEIVIVVFSFFFISYSITGFLKSREKELGLLSLFGMTKAQVRKLVIYENLIISAVSIVSGLILGALFSKLFFMAVTVILKSKGSIPFTLSIKAILVTVACFIVLFQGIHLFCVMRIKNNNIIELIRGSRKPKPVPRFSVFKSVLAIVLLAAGYGIAVFSYQLIIITMFPILILTVTGTYFLFTQFSLLFTRLLQRNKGVFYNGTNMIVLSQVIYKLKDNARVLFMVAVLGAVTLTASGSVYSLQEGFKASMAGNMPQDFTFYEKGENVHNVIEPGRVEEILKKHNMVITVQSRIVMLPASNAGSPQAGADGKNLYSGANIKDFVIMSSADYNKRAGELNKSTVNLKDGEAVIHLADFVSLKNSVFKEQEELSLKVCGDTAKFKLLKVIKGSVVNSDSNNSSLVVVSDGEFARLSAGAGEAGRLVYYGYNLKDWEDSFEAVKEIHENVTPGKKGYFNERVTVYSTFMRSTAMLLFIGIFIAVLFFIATGSIIYFKLFNDIQRDRAEFISLKKIGLSNREMSRIVGTQTTIIFFLPFVVATVHASFAIKAMENLTMWNLALYGLTVVLAYFVMQFAYFLFARSVYTRQIRSF